jgi:hypothetical protein
MIHWERWRNTCELCYVNENIKRSNKFLHHCPKKFFFSGKKQQDDHEALTEANTPEHHDSDFSKYTLRRA